MAPVQASVALGGTQTMTRSQKEYRRHAARCAELAMAARTPQLKATFLGLSKNWEKFAIDLEAAFGGGTETAVARSIPYGQSVYVFRCHTRWQSCPGYSSPM